MQLCQGALPDYHTAGSCVQLQEHDNVLSLPKDNGHSKICTKQETTLLLQLLALCQISIQGRQHLEK